MCGITGLVERPSRSSGRVLSHAVASMANAIAHRGPDRQGIWVDENAGLALGHRRLSILDLSPLGDQPMHSREGRFVLVFNGEIYNFKELRARLEPLGHEFRGSSDTEVMLAAFSEWGVVSALQAFNGMFALAVWDRESLELTLARDRLGEKPLFYGWSGESFIFGSELKALRAAPGFEGKVDRDVLALYFRHGCVPAPFSIYQGIHKLEAGHLLKLRPSTSQIQGLPEAEPYWRLEDAILSARQTPFEGTDAEAVIVLDRILSQSVSMRMGADVPLGAFLSGGVDSSLIVSLMQKQSPRPVKTFTIGFEDSDFNEATQARLIAAHLGTQHSEHLLTPKEAMLAIPRMPQFYDEPFSDSSQIATYLVAQHARNQVTVCLSGDAGDEFFAGYHRHFWVDRIWSMLKPVPRGLRTVTAAALGKLPPSVWKSLARLKPGLRPAVFSEQMRKLLEVLPAQTTRELYQTLVSHHHSPERLVLSSKEPRSALSHMGDRVNWESAGAEFQYLDAMTYLPDDILTKVDRATMAVSLEARVPFLDPEVIRFAWSLPHSMKVRDGGGKWILRRLLEQYLPAELIQRPKTGFGVPIGDWLRGPLRDWSESLLSDSVIRSQGFLNPAEVSRTWSEHVSGSHNRQHLIWDILMFQAWLEAERSTPSVS